LGIIVGDGGPIRVLPGQVRIPDAAFYSWDRFPDRQLPREPIPNLAPDLAIEVLSASNTQREMLRKLHDYFSAGVRVVWYVDPATRTAKVYTSEDRCTQIDASGKLDGGNLLAGFELELAALFRRAGERP
jgi:Uma2 family endonuclease